MNIEKFTSSQLSAVIDLYDRNKSKFYKYSFFIIGGFILFSLIPISFLPKSNRIDDSFDKSQNLIQGLGFTWWFLIVGTLCLIFIWALYKDLKIKELALDIDEEEILDDLFHISSVENHPKHNIFSIILKSENVKKIVMHMDQQNIGKYKVGQQFQFKILKNSHLLLSDIEK